MIDELESLRQRLGQSEAKESQWRQAEEALRWQANVDAALAELSRALLSRTPLEDIAHLVLEQAQRLTGSRFGYVGHIEPETGYLVCPTMTRDIWDVCQVQEKSP